MLVRRENFRNRLISLGGHRSLHVMTQAIDDATARVSRYLRLQLLVNICYGALIGTCLHFIGIPGALLWGVLVGLLRFLPYIGPPIGGILPLLLSFAIFDGWIKPLETFGLFVVTEILVSNFVEPALYGAYTGLSSMAILLAAIFWTAIWGPIGLVLSTPLTVCLVVIGRHVPRLRFLNVLLGDEPVLTADARYYQRLLAMDHEEAKRVLENFLKKKPLEDLYDSVLIPALSLAERDRHHERLDKVSAEFVISNTRRIIAELFEERRHEIHESSPPSREIPAPPNQPNESESRASLPARTPIANPKIVVVPARDAADEIVAAMLCQLLTRAGYAATCIPLGKPAEMILKSVQSAPDIVCISALPPYAVGHAKSVYAKLCAQLPQTGVLLGVWNYPGDLDRLAARIGLSDDHTLATTLSQALSEIAGRRAGLASDDSHSPAASPTTLSDAVPTFSAPRA